MSVSQLLAESRQAHVSAKHWAGRGANSDPAQYKAAILTAWEKRTAAVALDPGLADLAWRADTVAHDDLMAFFAQQLAR